MASIATVTKSLESNDGAQFWIHVSPQNNTAATLAKGSWKVIFEQGAWRGVITSDNPHQQLRTPGLSGEFAITVVVSPSRDESLQYRAKPLSWSSGSLSCDLNCGAIVGLFCEPNSTMVSYWTPWDTMRMVA